MRKVLLFFVMIFVSMVSICYAGLSDKVKNRCEAQWPGNQSMQELCIDQQTEGIQKFQEYLNKYTGKFYRFYAGLEGMRIMDKNEAFESASDDIKKGLIVLECREKWFDRPYNVADYPMVILCIEERFKAYDIMQGFH